MKVDCPYHSQPFWTDWSLWSLAASNVWAIVLAIVEKWPLADILWTFWFQSVTIGVFWFFKVLTLKNFSDDKVDINGRPIPPTLKRRNHMAIGFLLPYGFIHLVYAIFLWQWEHQAPSAKVVDKWPIIITAAIFFANHLFSFIHNRKWDDTVKPTLIAVLLFPYVRIIPMYLTIFIGLPLGLAAAGSLNPHVSSSSMHLKITFHLPYEPVSYSPLVVIFFMLLKTYADAIMHVIETRKFGCGRPPKRRTVEQ